MLGLALQSSIENIERHSLDTISNQDLTAAKNVGTTGVGSPV